MAPIFLNATYRSLYTPFYKKQNMNCNSVTKEHALRITMKLLRVADQVPNQRGLVATGK